jgi:polyhydroxyalkanoate synthesis regulator phasin
MVNYPTILNLPQEDINRQLYEMIVKLQKSEGADTKALEDAIDALEVRVKALEDAGGK